MKKTYHTEEKSLPPYQRTKVSPEPDLERQKVFTSRDGKTKTTVTYTKEEK